MSARPSAYSMGKPLEKQSAPGPWRVRSWETRLGLVIHAVIDADNDELCRCDSSAMAQLVASSKNDGLLAEDLARAEMVYSAAYANWDKSMADTREIFGKELKVAIDTLEQTRLRLKESEGEREVLSGAVDMLQKSLVIAKEIRESGRNV